MAKDKKSDRFLGGEGGERFRIARSFLRKIEILLAIKGWTKKDLSSRSNIPGPTIYGYWKDFHLPKASALKQIADAFSTTVDGLTRDIGKGNNWNNMLYRCIEIILTEATDSQLHKICGILDEDLLLIKKAKKENTA